MTRSHQVVPVAWGPRVSPPPPYTAAAKEDWKWWATVTWAGVGRSAEEASRVSPRACSASTAGLARAAPVGSQVLPNARTAPPRSTAAPPLNATRVPLLVVTLPDDND